MQLSYRDLSCLALLSALECGSSPTSESAYAASLSEEGLLERNANGWRITPLGRLRLANLRWLLGSSLPQGSSHPHMSSAGHPEQ